MQGKFLNPKVFNELTRNDVGHKSNMRWTMQNTMSHSHRCHSISSFTIAHLWRGAVITLQTWRGDHSTSISAYKVWGARTEIQISKRELHTHIHLDYVRIEILSCKKKKKKKKKTFNFKCKDSIQWDQSDCIFGFNFKRFSGRCLLYNLFSSFPMTY